MTPAYDNWNQSRETLRKRVSFTNTSEIDGLGFTYDTEQFIRPESLRGIQSNLGRSSQSMLRSGVTRIHPQMQGRNLTGRQDISEDPGTSKFEGSDVQSRRIPQQDL